MKAVCRARRASRGTGAAHRRREAACCWIGASICWTSSCFWRTARSARYTPICSCVKFPEVDDNFKVMLRFENGLSALVEVDTYTFIPLPRWHVSGEKGTLQVDDFACGGKMVCAKNTEMHWDEGIVYTAAGPTRTMAPRPRETVETLSLPQVQTDARDYYVNFRDAQQGGREPAVTHRQMLAVMRVIDAIFVSAKEHRAVKPEE